MAIQTFDANMDIISALSDTPNETLSASALKAKFDEGGGLIKTYINGTLVPAINGILTVLTGKQDTLTFDEEPTSGSNNPVRSKGILSKLNEKAPTDHSNTGTTYGVGDDGKYGHVKLLAAVNSTLGVNDGTAATPSAVRDAYNKANAALPKNGSGTMSGALAMGGYKVTNLGTPTSDTDAATKKYVDDKVNDHSDDAATGSVLGHVKLSDSTSSTSAASSGIAATPKAVNDVRILANGKYTKPSGGIPASDIASGVIPSAYTSNPAMNGNASAGSSGSWAKGDHVHPTDTTRQAKITANGVLQGNGSGTITARAVEASAPSSGSSSLITSGAVYSGLSGKLNLSGGTMTGDLTLKGDPTSALHASTKQYVDNAASAKLNLSGGTMSGAINMGSKKITSLATPTANADAATKQYVDNADATKLNLSGGTMTGDINMGNHHLTYLRYPVLDEDAASKKYVDDKIASKVPIYKTYSGSAQAIFESIRANYGASNIIGVWHRVLNTSVSPSMYEYYFLPFLRSEIVSESWSSGGQTGTATVIHFWFGAFIGKTFKVNKLLQDVNGSGQLVYSWSGLTDVGTLN